MLSLIDTARHGLKGGRGGAKLVDCLGVERERIVGDGGCVGRQLGERNGCERVVMRWTEEKDPFSIDKMFSNRGKDLCIFPALTLWTSLVLCTPTPRMVQSTHIRHVLLEFNPFSLDNSLGHGLYRVRTVL